MAREPRDINWIWASLLIAASVAVMVLASVFLVQPAYSNGCRTDCPGVNSKALLGMVALSLCLAASAFWILGANNRASTHPALASIGSCLYAYFPWIVFAITVVLNAGERPTAAGVGVAVFAIVLASLAYRLIRFWRHGVFKSSSIS